MKNFLISLLCLFSLSVFANEKEELLSTWEKLQSSHPQVELFEKITDGKYHIKFSTLPYDGNLTIIDYDTEPFDDENGYLFPFVKRGYIEIHLTDTDENLAAKFPHTYQRWAKTNMLFLNSATRRWVTNEEMTRHFRQQYSNSPAGKPATESREPGFFFSWEPDYFIYLFLFVLLYFIYLAYSEARAIRKSLELQKQASRELERNMKQVEEGIKLHTRTNQLLEELLREIRQQKP